MLCDLGTHQLAYEISGPTSAAPLLFGHCFASNRHFFDDQLPALTDYQIIRYDTRGHGESGTPVGPYRMDDLGNDAIALLDHLQIKQTHYVGVSMGGMIGQNIALRFPERLLSLGLINTISAYDDIGKQVWKDWVTKVRQSGATSMSDDLMNRWFTPDALHREIPGVVYMNEAYRSFSDTAFEFIAEAIIKDLHYSDRINNIKISTLIVASPNDPGIPQKASELLHHRIDGSKLEWLTPAHHLATLEHPETFNTILSEFLATQPKN
ncbi:MAG: alpha/beta fold hydrolase [Chloroflexota bacterium]|nr:alpha/beta fold hydrolase [Chloroflexota bacterium]PKB60472.1 MAG: hypothetical protein BZY65_01080 [SAR202 cluster bacterium Ae2-Chloro-G2]